ncbi:hypothetical protein KSS87_019711 [Heliosperma pusillum]|nr:hypothetical protein KSS87_019711 [Heliosperma pusillum]
MAGHGDSSGKSKDAMDDLTILNAESMMSNMKIINYSRTFMSIIAGVMAGIVGFNGVIGFVFYIIVMAITSLGLTAKANFSVHSYFDAWNRVLLDGFFGGLMVILSFLNLKY